MSLMDLSKPFTIGRRTFPSAEKFTGRRYLANISLIVEMPKLLVPDAGARNRINKAQTDSVVHGLTVAMKKYHREVVPLHFHRSRQRKYTFKRRSFITERIKARRGVRGWNLVQTRATKQKMTRQLSPPRRVRIGTGIAVAAHMRFPAGMVDSSGRGQQVTMRDMKREIQQMTRDETAQVTQDVADAYFAELNKRLTPRQRRRITNQPTRRFRSFAV